MKVKKQIWFNTEDSQELVAYLKKNEIAFEEVDHFSTVDIFDDDPHWPALLNYVNKQKLRCVSETIFSKKELFEAEWLTIYSQYRFGYPQPEGKFEYRNITYSSKNFCPYCDSGLEQVDSFRMKKVPKWGKRNFMELNWIGDELFLSEAAKIALEDAQITGINFRRVKNKAGENFLDDIYQLAIPTLSEKGLVEEHTGIKEITRCPHCGQKKYVTNGIGMLAFQKEIFTNAPDVLKSVECFGSGHYISRVILVRQKVYRAIMEKDLGRALVFEPILLL